MKFKWRNEIYIFRCVSPWIPFPGYHLQRISAGSALALSFFLVSINWSDKIKCVEEQDRSEQNTVKSSGGRSM